MIFYWQEKWTSCLAASVNRAIKPGHCSALPCSFTKHGNSCWNVLRLTHLPSPASPCCHPFIGKALAHCWLNQAYSSEVDIMTAIRDAFRAGQISLFSSYLNMMLLRSTVVCTSEKNAKHGCHCHHNIACSNTGRTGDTVPTDNGKRKGTPYKKCILIVAIRWRGMRNVFKLIVCSCLNMCRLVDQTAANH